ncbi:hypothetical protein [Mixta intestinalis]|jgi:hypothetical protein|uniref:Uncharacterized protein n=1 Tax=Mixta intestinalis TaxID=1615494 RepID=A0A6P1PU77_9GAMM|nr:hypothetical protein [Mixta intestinalis]QHM69843.1 hypothetical protein C7M51_00096 [Mixta intestinalis]
MRVLTEAQLAHVSGAGNWSDWIKWDSNDFSGSYEGSFGGVDVTVAWGGSYIIGFFPILALPGMIFGAFLESIGNLISSLFPPAQES